MHITKGLRSLAAKAYRLLARFNIDGRGYVSSSGGYAGMWVDRDRALTSATFYAGMNLIGGTISHLGFDIYREAKSGSREVASAHSLHEVLKYEPNQHSTAIEYWQRIIWDQELSGNGYSKIVRTGSGDVIGLLPWEPDRVSIYTDKPEWRYEYQPGNAYQPEKLNEWTNDVANVFHLRNVTVDGVYGLSTVDLAKQRIGLDLAVEKYGATFFGKGGRVKDIFKFPGMLKPDQRDLFKQLFREQYGNADSFHDVLMLEGGAEMAGKSGSTPDEAQFTETQIQSAIVLCRFLGIPPTLVGILDRATYNNQEQLMLQFLTLCLMPRIERIEQAARRALLTRAEKRAGYFIHSKAQKILRGDSKARSEYYKTLMSLGVMNAEEIRDLEDMPRIGTAEASEYLRAQNIFGPPAGAEEPEANAEVAAA